MIIEFLSELGIWSWLVLGLVLLILEILAPGIFFIWFGLAALVTGGMAFLLSSTSAFGWQVQLVVFLVLAVVFALAGRRFFGSKSENLDEPLLNRRGEQLVGQRTTLTEPIINGRGRIRINDTTWRVKGPDLPAGTEVRVVAFDAVTLEIEVAV
ncbi:MULTISPECIES: NfeD family protein [Brucella]|uniref:NfeD family protein n=2 Tax=Ochrobactrum TaxID=528 RepID=A0ABD5JT28_9HYPH|nr:MULTISPECIES: NfeD family protein [Brucella]RRD21848.1 NfeD family protein [Brucellaceae bacterium VT-16-1752]WHT43812.1 NfeD family protein [Ochrobactrum sp. SSR]MDX4076486.1 NfeD family protein [Brucella sp. NBRC 113783]WHS33712.1 NfeD family protein [Brucella sp. NM4]SPL63863.1 Putative activity regulator of membrane protease YbbK [[Ochrobactrum] soli]